METKARRQFVLLAILVVLSAVALWWNLGPGESSGPAGGSRRAAQVAGGRPAAAPAVVEPVALDALRAAPPEPRAARRNPFRFGQRSAATPDDDGPGAWPAAVPPPPIAQAPAGPPAPPPIPLRFIGVVDETGRRLKLAVLSDGRSVFYGREGDIIEGRYRIVRIGLESIEMTHVDGRGQQTIRLSGS